MIKSETIKELAIALALAQGKIKNAVTNVENPFFKSKYADLASVREAYQSAFEAQGLSLLSLPETDDDGNLVLTSILLHKSGEYIGSSVQLRPLKQDPQGIGSAITYQRRYSAAAIAGVAIEDDDGEAAHGRGEKKQEGAISKGFRKVDAPKDEPKTHPEPTSAQPEVSEGFFTGLIAEVKTIDNPKFNPDEKVGGKNWRRRYGITMQDDPEGRVFGTFDDDIADFAATAHKKGTTVRVAISKRGKFYNCENIDFGDIAELPIEDDPTVPTED